MACPVYKEISSEIWSNDVEPIGKKFQKLNQFTKQVAESIKNADDADRYLETIQDQDFFSQKTKLELANVLKRPAPIFEALKNENELLQTRALSFKWVYAESSNNTDFLINELLPNISYSCRKKVIYRIGNLSPTATGGSYDAGNVTKLFEAIDETYGINLARLLLPACDKSLLNTIISEKRIKFSISQLGSIYKRHPDVTLKYLEGLYGELMSNEGWHNRVFGGTDYCPSILRIMAKTNPSEFMTFYEKFEKSATTRLHMGPKLTKFLLKHDKQRVINCAKIYSKILSQSQIMKRLSIEEFTEFITLIFPSSIRNFQLAFELGEGNSRPLFTWLDKFPPEVRFASFNNCFEKAYKKSITDFPEYMTSRMIQLQNPQERDKWIDLRLSLPDSESQYFYRATGHIPLHRDGYWEAFRSTDKSIPKIKQFLSTESDVLRRADLLSSLVLSCAVNKDKQSLIDVCQFVPTRFRNDNTQVRLEFLEALNKLFDLSKLEKEHWTGINELLQISSMNNEFSHRIYLLESILKKSIFFRVKNGLEAESQIQQYFKLMNRLYFGGHSWFGSVSDPSLELKCLKQCIEQLIQMYPLTSPCPVDSAITTTIISLAEAFPEWNRRGKRSKNKVFLSAEDYPWLMSRLKDVLVSYHENNKYRIIHALDVGLLSKLLEPQKLFKSCPLPKVLKYYLRTEPKKLQEFSDVIISFLLGSDHITQWKDTLKQIRDVGSSDLTETYVNKCLEIAEDEDSTIKERVNAVFALSILLEARHFVDWISQFYPTDPKADTNSEHESVGPYQLRKAVATNLINMIIPSAGIPALLQFCKGDYLKFVVGSLYSICSRSVGDKLLEFLTELATRPVSVKKHAIRLMLILSSKNDNIKFLKHLWDTEKHHSIRSIVCNQIFELFLENNSEDSWTLLTSVIKSFTVDDHALLGELGLLGRRDYINSTKMPLSKISEYLELILSKLDELVSLESEWKWAKMNILQCITPLNINSISQSLLETIFEKHLFILNDDTNLQSSTINVAINYLLHCTTAKIEIITTYMERLTSTTEWSNLSKDSLTMFPAKQSLSYFIEQLAIESFKFPFNEHESSAQGKYGNIFSALHKSLNSYKDNSEFFVDDLIIRFSIIFHSIPLKKHNESGEELVEIGKEIGTLIEELVSVHKPEIVSIISDTLKRFISLCYKYRLTENGSLDGARVIFLIEGILESNSSIDSQIVGSHLLLTTNSHWPKGHPYEKKHCEIMKKLLDSQDKTIRIFVNYRITQCRPTRGYDVLV